jgi:hypothetical protein
MLLLRYARGRLDAFLDETRRLQALRFPYAHSEEALKQIEDCVQGALDDLNLLATDNDPDVTKTVCADALSKLHEFVPLLGFITRSTGARNSFEAYGPLLRLAQQLLAADSRLIISSEWDFSPFVYLYPDLSEFVLLGLPATESENPLLLSLAGHEFGHALWRNECLEAVYSGRVTQEIVKNIKLRWSEYSKLHPQFIQDELEDSIEARRTWDLARHFGLAQTEEIFCDVVALRLFGEAYLHAFAYVVSPHTGHMRALTYPNTRTRAQHLEIASRALEVTPPAGFLDLFEDDPEHQNSESRFLVSIADAASAALLSELVDRVRQLTSARSIPKCKAEKVGEILSEFRSVVPASSAETLVDILDAAWKCYYDDNLWVNVENIQRDDRLRVLRDLVLKSFEILEVKELVGAYRCR